MCCTSARRLCRPASPASFPPASVLTRRSGPAQGSCCNASTASGARCRPNNPPPLRPEGVASPCMHAQGHTRMVLPPMLRRCWATQASYPGGTCSAASTVVWKHAEPSFRGTCRALHGGLSLVLSPGAAGPRVHSCCRIVRLAVAALLRVHFYGCTGYKYDRMPLRVHWGRNGSRVRRGWGASAQWPPRGQGPRRHHRLGSVLHRLHASAALSRAGERSYACAAAAPQSAVRVAECVSCVRATLIVRRYGSCGVACARTGCVECFC